MHCDCRGVLCRVLEEIRDIPQENTREIAGIIDRDRYRRQSTPFKHFRYIITRRAEFILNDKHFYESVSPPRESVPSSRFYQNMCFSVDADRCRSIEHQIAILIEFSIHTRSAVFINEFVLRCCPLRLCRCDFPTLKLLKKRSDIVDTTRGPCWTVLLLFHLYR